MSPQMMDREGLVMMVIHLRLRHIHLFYPHRPLHGNISAVNGSQRNVTITGSQTSTPCFRLWLHGAITKEPEKKKKSFKMKPRRFIPFFLAQLYPLLPNVNE